jgi:hypothetical protein
MQRRDFFLNGRPADVRSPAGFPDGFEWRSSFAEDSDLTMRLIEAWISDRGFRERLMVECRQAAWKVRNARGCGEWQFDESLRLLIETAHLMLWAGECEVDVMAWVGCMGHACNCDGCDLWDGARWTSGTRAVPFFSD